MKPEDVPQEWLDLARDVFCALTEKPARRLPLPGWFIAREREAMAHALAAVAPLSAAAEREACAKGAETHEWFVGGIGTKAPGSGESRAIAAAIRARGSNG